jgi:hypothetical protein
MVAGRKRYIEVLHAMGLKAPGGPRPSVAKVLRQLEQAIQIADAAIAGIAEAAIERETQSKS